jgi:SEC-C motif
MKKIKSPWYGLAWIVIWTAALAWFLNSGLFSTRESIGLVLVWLVLVGITLYLLIQHLRAEKPRPARSAPATSDSPSLNAPCPCGSGKKYKRCCGASKG